MAGAAVSRREARGARGDRRDPGVRRAGEPQGRGGAEPPPSPGARSAPPGSSPTPLPTLTPAPTASSVDPNPTPTPDPSLTPTPTPDEASARAPTTGPATPTTAPGAPTTAPATRTTAPAPPARPSARSPAGAAVRATRSSSSPRAPSPARRRSRRRPRTTGETVGILKSDELLLAQRRLLRRVLGRVRDQVRRRGCAGRPQVRLPRRLREKGHAQLLTTGKYRSQPLARPRRQRVLLEHVRLGRRRVDQHGHHRRHRPARARRGRSRPRARRPAARRHQEPRAAATPPSPRTRPRSRDRSPAGRRGARRSPALISTSSGDHERINRHATCSTSEPYDRVPRAAGHRQVDRVALARAGPDVGRRPRPRIQRRLVDRDEQHVGVRRGRCRWSRCRGGRPSRRSARATGRARTSPAAPRPRRCRRSRTPIARAASA